MKILKIIRNNFSSHSIIIYFYNIKKMLIKFKFIDKIELKIVLPIFYLKYLFILYLFSYLCCFFILNSYIFHYYLYQYLYYIFKLIDY